LIYPVDKENGFIQIANGFDAPQNPPKQKILLKAGFFIL